VHQPVTAQPRVVIVGGGISGLSAAWTCHEAGVPVRLFEVAGRSGGVMVSERTPDDFLVEWGPNTVQGTPDLLTLADRSGTRQLLVTADPVARNRYVCHRGRLHPVPMSPPALLTSRLLGPVGKLRVLGERLVRGRSIPGESARAFGHRRLGKQATERLLVPFLSGIYAGDPDELGYAEALPKIHSLEAEHGSLIKGFVARAKERRRRGETGSSIPPLVSARDGLQTWAEALASNLEERRPGTVLLEHHVEQLVPDETGCTIRWPGGEMHAPAVLLTLPHRRIATLLPAADRDAFLAGGEPPHASVAVQHWLFRSRPEPDLPPGFGALFPQHEGSPFLGVLTPGYLFPDRHPPGGQLWTLFFGGRSAPEWIAATRQERTEAAAGFLGRLLGGATPSPDRVEERVVQHGICQYTTAHGQVLAAADAVEARHDGLFLAGDWRGGIGVPDRVTAGRAAASRVLAHLGIEPATAR
jgi:oxygen-dependent protoporphyrinogen oxidase